MTILLGYSGHGYVVAEAFLLQSKIINGYADKSETHKNPFKLSYLGYENAVDFAFWIENAHFLLGIGDNRIRTKVAAIVRSKQCQCLTVVHNNSSISSFVNLGTGVFVGRNAAINPFCNIGNDVIINTSSSIDHECLIHDGVHIAPGAVLAGNVSVGRNAFVGANAVVKQGVSVGAEAVIGAGAVVLRDVPIGETWAGNPAKPINK